MLLRQIINGIFIFLAIVFFVLGIIGLMIPVVPQVPFFAASLFFAANGSKRFKNWFKKHKVYRKHLLPIVRRHKFLRELFEEDETDGESES